MIGPAEENTERRMLVLEMPALGKPALGCRCCCVAQCRFTYSAGCSVPWPKFAGGEQRGEGRHGRGVLFVDVAWGRLSNDGNFKCACMCMGAPHHQSRGLHIAKRCPRRQL